MQDDGPNRYCDCWARRIWIRVPCKESMKCSTDVLVGSASAKHDTGYCWLGNSPSMSLGPCRDSNLRHHFDHVLESLETLL